ncbi:MULTISPECIES: rRNA maturation RNase YbeY [Kosmotoga]|jgi:probable rRNA maturation factor|uniref:Endoribonuclease YbeY n=1 Tax=Kosmotoga olearia (strain ATCC BAA-1733 / DSM 21960 / TBF 19.5.1) TaxID=521045 RepID=C5CFX4_KOSOT|nr:MULTISPECIES: rRNA maturation RNase YbeY [Kosmotoga]ACR80468.1 protein of unknown function UPF0054 [Kosmotoga olearia TBF 19.5.1]MDI3523440.1 putative rRNA maturation factor [Kosmotoga sp.]MDK2952938.1 putative rRNA maturation factor [Kosmotoga sp.]OAA19361.1 rRNA maturation factor [Kosmotoga sp. DU53]
MKIIINNATSKEVDTDRLKELIVKILESELDELPDSTLNVLLTTDEEMTYYNETYRHKKGPTDVLSFEYGLDDPEAVGDIVISLETIEKQAKEFGNTFQEELSLMLIHGVLHILGYDHEGDEEEAKIMFEKQEDYFNKYGKNISI